MEGHTIEVARNVIDHIFRPFRSGYSQGCRWRIHIVSTPWQIFVVHVTDSIVGVLSEREVLALGPFPPLIGDVWLIGNLEVVDIIVVAYIQPVNGSKHMFPPFIPVRSGRRWVVNPLRIPL